VFDVVADAARQDEWHPRVKSVECLTDSPRGRGSRYRGRYRGFGSVEFETVEVASPDCVAFQSETKGGRMTHSFKITSEGAGTKLKQRMVLEPHAMMRVVGPAMKGALRKQLARNGAALRAHLEGGG
jgi:hypothetical protein